METVLNMIVNAENVRMLLVVVFGFSGFVLIKASIKELRASIKEQNTHLNSTIEALTYALEKNGSLKKEDKEYVDSRLAH